MEGKRRNHPGRHYCCRLNGVAATVGPRITDAICASLGRLLLLGAPGWSPAGLPRDPCGRFRGPHIRPRVTVRGPDHPRTLVVEGKLRRSDDRVRVLPAGFGGARHWRIARSAVSYFAPAR